MQDRHGAHCVRQKSFKNLGKNPWEIQLAAPRNQSGNKRQNMIPPRWPFPTLHAGSSWAVNSQIPSRQSCSLSVCSLLAPPCCRGCHQRTGRTFTSPLHTCSMSWHYSKRKYSSSSRAIFKGTVLVCPQSVAKRMKYSRCHLQARQDTLQTITFAY